MNSLLNQMVSRWALFFFATALAVLGAAFFFQYGLGYQPCELCLYQRYPYMLVVVVSLLAFFVRNKNDVSSRRASRGFLVIITALLLLDAFLAIHHIGVEQGYWKAFTACTGADIDFNSTKDILSQLPASSVPCDQRRTFLGRI